MREWKSFLNESKVSKMIQFNLVERLSEKDLIHIANIIDVSQWNLLKNSNNFNNFNGYELIDVNNNIIQIENINGFANFRYYDNGGFESIIEYGSNEYDDIFRYITQ